MTEITRHIVANCSDTYCWSLYWGEDVIKSGPGKTALRTDLFEALGDVMHGIVEVQTNALIDSMTDHRAYSWFELRDSLFRR